MSKDFEAALADALDHTAHVTQTAGPTAARIRGRKRTMRKRIALSTTSLVFVTIGATAAFTATSSHGGGTPQLTNVTPYVTTSKSPSPTTAPSRSATTIPAPSLPATSGTPSSSQATTADPHQVVGSAWLTASQMPFDSTFHWTAAPADTTGGQQLTPTVAYLANNASLQSLTMCADPTQLLDRTVGAQITAFTATAGTGNDQASQYVFFFADATSAQQTYAWLQSQYGSSCLLHGTGAQVTKTAGDGTTDATWLTLKGTSTSPDLADYTREYFVLRGSTIAFVSVTSYTGTLPTAYADAAQLSTIAAHLCVYGGPCD
jgi:hypothetical protein